MDLSLEALREEIDRIDEVVVRLLDRRARCAFAIGRLKREQGLAIYEPAREASVMAHVKAVNAALGGPLDDSAVGRLYERVMDEARRIQRIEHEKSLPHPGAEDAAGRPLRRPGDADTAGPPRRSAEGADPAGLPRRSAESAKAG